MIDRPPDTGRTAHSDRAGLALVYQGVGGTDAIFTYTQQLGMELSARGDIAAVLLTRRPGATWPSSEPGGTSRLSDALAPFHTALVQYNPFSYGRWGFAPWLPRELLRARRRGTRVALMVHEAFVDPHDVRHRLMNAWQRAQLRALLLASDHVFASTEVLSATVGQIVPRRDVVHLPVGSNLPDRRHDRRGARVALQLDDDDFAIVGFSTGHVSQLGPWIGLAARAAQAAGQRPTVVNLGAGAATPAAVPNGVRVITPGLLPAETLAAYIAAGDLFVAAFSDGVSTRRTTVMAALQHAVPVIGTLSAGTDSVFKRGAVSLVDPQDPDEFHARVRALATQPELRATLSRDGRRLYEHEFAWSMIAKRIVDSLSLPAAPSFRA